MAEAVKKQTFYENLFSVPENMVDEIIACHSGVLTSCIAR
jgi:hypothetical protein